MHVKNKAAAAVQITAEQLVQEAADRTERQNVAPRRTIADEDELQEYRMDKRKQFEDALRRNRASVPAYLKYAMWEESQHELDRARSVYERAVDEDPRNVTFWLKYAELEMRHRNSNRARNVWDRAVHILPRQTQLWYKYAFMEDVLGNYVGERLVFERWMQWNPAEPAWLAYAKFELRVGQVARARSVYERLVAARPSVSAWLRYARFEEAQHDTARARDVYTRAIDALSNGSSGGDGDDGSSELGDDPRLFVAFAAFEQRAHEDERARAIYRYALDHVPRARADALYAAFATFEKTHGTRESIEDVLASQRRLHYEEQLAAAPPGAPPDYDVWFDYIRLEEEHGDIAQIREVYERAVACVPPVAEKRFWRRYIYLWLKYAVFEELVAGDAARARQVYAAAVKLVPHRRFSFSKLWIQYAQLEVRQLQLAAARRVFGTALGLCGGTAGSATTTAPAPPTAEEAERQRQQHHCRAKIYRAYIALEFQLGEIARCRTLYAGYVASDPSYCRAYMEYAQMEHTLHETPRARAILELAVAQPVLDTPEKLWKFYIDLEVAGGDVPRARALYRRLLEQTQHVKVWLSYARFEHETAHSDANARAVLRDADACLRAAADTPREQQQQQREARALVAEAALSLERDIGDPAAIAAAQARLPQRVRRRRPLQAADGADAGWEEYWEYVFPGEDGDAAAAAAAASPAMRLLERARLWKRQRLAAEGTGVPEPVTVKTEESLPSGSAA